jgi:predicted MFS family arabinose efflux permease
MPSHDIIISNIADASLDSFLSRPEPAACRTEGRLTIPLVIHVFTLSAFALGLAEFVPIGLTDVMAHGLNVSLEQAGTAITTYAVGATFAAPVLTALTVRSQ